MNGPGAAGRSLRMKATERARTQLRDRSSQCSPAGRLPEDLTVAAGWEGGCCMMPDLKTTETRGHATPANDRDELAELLLYVWLRSEVNDDWGLPLVMEQ